MILPSGTVPFCSIAPAGTHPGCTPPPSSLAASLVLPCGRGLGEAEAPASALVTARSGSCSGGGLGEPSARGSRRASCCRGTLLRGAWRGNTTRGRGRDSYSSWVQNEWVVCRGVAEVELVSLDPLGLDIQLFVARVFPDLCGRFPSSCGTDGSAAAQVYSCFILNKLMANICQSCNVQMCRKDAA